MSLRRPTVACTVFIFCYKPFMWCRPDARLWHYYSAFTSRGVFQTLVWHPHYYSAFSARGVFQTLVWHLYYYFAFSARGVFQTLVWHQYYYSAVSARGVIQTLAWHPVFIISMSDRTGYLVNVLHVYICYTLCPNCLASTFIVLTWLVDLARC